MLSPEFTSVDAFIKSNLPKAPSVFPEPEKHQWTFMQFLQTIDLDAGNKKLTGWQKANRGNVEDVLNPIEISRLTSFAKEFTGKNEVTLCEAIDVALVSFRNSGPISLEQKVTTSAGKIIGLKKDYLVDTQAPTVYQEACDNYVNEKFQQLALSCLSSLEMQVLQLRQDGIIQKDIAKQLGLRSKAAVANLERKAIWKLRDNLSMQQLFDKTN